MKYNSKNVILTTEEYNSIIAYQIENDKLRETIRSYENKKWPIFNADNEKLIEENRILKSDINDLKDAIVKLVFKM